MRIFKLKTLMLMSTLLVCIGFLNPVHAATRNGFLKVHRGMTYGQVWQVLGLPNDKRFGQHREEWLYTIRSHSNHFIKNKVVVFKSGRVTTLYDEKSRSRHIHHYPKHKRNMRHMHPAISLFQINLKP